LLIGVRAGCLLAAGLLAIVAANSAATHAADGAAPLAVGAPGANFEAFLDRLMRAESNGHDFAANPRSTALGPFQFIKATFLEVARRHFPDVATLEDVEVLALRTDRAYARRAAAIYSMENLAYLTGKGLQPALGDLRLAFLVGPAAAARLMQAQPSTPVGDIVGSAAIKANPFMAGMSASDLIARSARDVGEPRRASVALVPKPRLRPTVEPASRPGVAQPAGIVVRCNRMLVACQRWIVMQANKQRVAQQQTAASRKAANRAPGKRNRPGV
jgi:hypothetical protein